MTRLSAASLGVVLGLSCSVDDRQPNSGVDSLMGPLAGAAGPCDPATDESVCDAGAVRYCDPAGSWAVVACPTGEECQQGQCVAPCAGSPCDVAAVCAAGARRCNPDPELCRTDGTGWDPQPACSGERSRCVEATGLCGDCSPGDSRPCQDVVLGPCQGAISAAPRDCRSTADNDCDGVPDDTIDDVCQCVPGAVEDCDTHPGNDGRGICRAGTRTCVPSAGFLSSNWSACTGAVGPRSRNCGSSTDNDCDGLPDSTSDAVCQCQPGTTRFCGDLPVPILGRPDFTGCGTGNATCQVAPDLSSSSWGDCVCAGGEYCSLPVGDCSLPQLGKCSTIPAVCSFVVLPVCGCDGVTYNNACNATRAGVSVQSSGECASAP